MYPKEYILYLVHFHGDRDYFECHEVLEEYWKKVDRGNKQSIWVAFIQLAVSAYHHRRGNFKGAKKSINKAAAIFSKEAKTAELGLNKEALLCLINERSDLIGQKKPYGSFNLPIVDPILNEQCKTVCKDLGFIWLNKNDKNNIHLLHRHKLRDRSDVIQARLIALKNKERLHKNEEKRC